MAQMRTNQIHRPFSDCNVSSVVEIFQTITVRSLLPETICLPSGLKATLLGRLYQCLARGNPRERCFADGWTVDSVVVDDAVQVVFPPYQNGRVVQEKASYLDKLDQIAIAGHVVHTDSKKDLAVVQLESLPEEVDELPLASKDPKPGDTIHSIGSPGASSALWVYTSGTVRSVHRKKTETARVDYHFKVIETQSPTNHGDSGGPVVDSRGFVVGMSQSYAADVRLMSYCVAADEVRPFRWRRYWHTTEPKTAEEFVDRAWEHFGRADFERAVADANKALTLDPQNVHAYSARAAGH